MRCGLCYHYYGLLYILVVCVGLGFNGENSECLCVVLCCVVLSEL